TAFSNASTWASVGCVTPLTLRTYWRAAAAISSSVAGGSSPRSVVMLRHMSVHRPSSTGARASTLVARYHPWDGVRRLEGRLRGILPRPPAGQLEAVLRGPPRAVRAGRAGPDAGAGR